MSTTELENYLLNGLEKLQNQYDKQQQLLTDTQKETHSLIEAMMRQDEELQSQIQELNEKIATLNGCIQSLAKET